MHGIPASRSPSSRLESPPTSSGGATERARRTRSGSSTIGEAPLPPMSCDIGEAPLPPMSCDIGEAPLPPMSCDFEVPMRTCIALLLLCCSPLAGALGGVPALYAFTPETMAVEQATEQRFDAQINPLQMTDWLKRLSAEPNQVGSPHDKANAEWVRDQFRQWGWEADIESFEVLYPTLKSHRLELTAPTPFIASLVEAPIPGDPTSARADAMPAYNVYGADGDVSG